MALNEAEPQQEKFWPSGHQRWIDRTGGTESPNDTEIMLMIWDRANYGQSFSADEMLYVMAKLGFDPFAV